MSSGGGGGGGGSSTAPASSESDVSLIFDFDNLLSMGPSESLFAKIIDYLTLTDICHATPLYDYAKTIYIEVTSPGMATRTNTQSIVDHTSPITVTMTIPNGANRTFNIKLRDRNGFNLYEGEMLIDVGTTTGAAQNINVSVNVTDDVTAADYVSLGRDCLKDHTLELAFIAFDTAISLDAHNAEANFFCAFTRVLLLVQKDDPLADAASPNEDIADLLNLYSDYNDIYDSAESTIVPDIYDTNYGDDLDTFDDTWELPDAVLDSTTSDGGVNVVEDVLLPEIDRALSNLDIVDNDSDFATTIMAGWHHDMDETIEVDLGDVYFLQAALYAYKGYLNRLLANNWHTEVRWWDTNLDDDNPGYVGIQDVLDRDTTSPEVGALAAGVSTYLSIAKTAFSNGTDKIKAAIQYVRDSDDSYQDDDMFQIDEDADLTKIIANIDDIKSSLTSQTTFREYDSYKESVGGTDYESFEIDISSEFTTATAFDKGDLPTFYYHTPSDSEIPLYDTLNPSFDGLLPENTSVAAGIKNDTYPSHPYKFDVSSATITIDGVLSDWQAASIGARMFNYEDANIADSRNVEEIYLAKDANYLYIAIKFYGTPSNILPSSGEWVDYRIHFNVKNDDVDYWGAPLIITLEAHGDNGWQWLHHSYGQNKGALNNAGYSYSINDVVEMRIPLSGVDGLVDRLTTYEGDLGGSWDQDMVFISTECSWYLSSVNGWNGLHDNGYLADLP